MIYAGTHSLSQFPLIFAFNLSLFLAYFWLIFGINMLFSELLGDSHADTIVSMNNLAEIFAVQGM